MSKQYVLSFLLLALVGVSIIAADMFSEILVIC